MRSELSIVTVGGALAVAGALGNPHVSRQAAAALPTIVSVEPPSPTSWSYIVISGENLMSADGSCSVLEEIVPGVIRLKLRPGTDIAAVLALEGDPPERASQMGDPGDPFMGDWYQVDVPPGSEFAKSISYSRHPQVLYAGPAPIPQAADVPNDPLYPSQWALTKIDAPTAWTVSKGDGIKIAIIDSGFAASHPDLGPHMLPGWNCDGTRDVSPLSAHGTAVAGIAAAATDNTQGIAGVAWNGVILPLRLDTLADNPCQPAYDSFLVDKAIEEGAKVINMSLTYGVPNPALCDKLSQARAAGLVSVAAAGNGGSSVPLDPAACAAAIAVAASDENDNRADFPGWWSSNFGSWVDVSAPGVAILTTAAGNGYEESWGTSAAAPHVAGVAALLSARGFYPCEIEETIKEAADPINWQGGAGRLNAGRALNHWGGGPIVTPGNLPDGALIRGEGDPRIRRRPIERGAESCQDRDRLQT